MWRRKLGEPYLQTYDNGLPNVDILTHERVV